MQPVNVMINGIPGKVAINIAEHVLSDSRFKLIPWSLTGPDIGENSCMVKDVSVRLVTPADRSAEIKKILSAHGSFITIDFTLPAAVNDNARFYCKNDLPFVMGTTGGDRAALEETVRASSISAVIAPNMVKQIVGFQAMMEYAAENFPGLFAGYHLNITESHQQTKVDTSGTAKAMVTYFNALGVPFKNDDIVQIRDPEIQKNQMGIPEAYLTGHGWHTYSLTSPDDTVKFSFTHNINGRDIYAGGTLDAVMFLCRKMEAGSKGRVFTMIDVLKGNQSS